MITQDLARLRAERFARSRPPYATAAIDFLCECIGAPELTIDLGAGTLIGAVQLAARYRRVVAVDISRAMLEAGGAPGPMTCLEARAEQLPLRSGVAGLITAFTAFHAFETGAALRECWRVLRRGGYLAAVSNEWDRSDPCTGELYSLMKRYATWSPLDDPSVVLAPLHDSKLFEKRDLRSFPMVHLLDEPRLLERMQTTAALVTGSQKARELQEGVRDIHGRYHGSDGNVTQRYRTVVSVARRAESGAAVVAR